jgi:hypothetical protein
MVSTEPFSCSHSSASKGVSARRASCPLTLQPILPAGPWRSPWSPPSRSAAATAVLRKGFPLGGRPVPRHCWHTRFHSAQAKLAPKPSVPSISNCTSIRVRDQGTAISSRVRSVPAVCIVASPEPSLSSCMGSGMAPAVATAFLFVELSAKFPSAPCYILHSLRAFRSCSVNEYMLPLHKPLTWRVHSLLSLPKLRRL